MNDKDKKLYKDYLDNFSKLNLKEKDDVLVRLFIIMEKNAIVLEKIIHIIKKYVLDPKQKKVLNEEIKEIENIISLGIPGWLRFTRRTKKSKK